MTMDIPSWHVRYASTSGGGILDGADVETTNNNQGHSIELLILVFICPLEVANALATPFLFLPYFNLRL